MPSLGCEPPGSDLSELAQGCCSRDTVLASLPLALPRRQLLCAMDGRQAQRVATQTECHLL